MNEQIKIDVVVSGTQKSTADLKKFQQTTKTAMSESESAVARSIGNMVKSYASLTAAVMGVRKLASTGMEFNKFVENTTMSFGVMMKSAEGAKKQMKELYDFAVNSPLTFKETAASAKQLMAYGFAAKDLVPTMKSLGTVAIATGHSLDDISYIYGTLKSQGRAYSRDLMQFGMRGIPIYEELAVVMGVSADKIQKLASEGKIGFAQVEKAFQNMTTNGGRFAGILEGYMDTLTGKLSMLSDMWEQTTGNLMGGAFLEIKNVVEAVTKAIASEGFKDFIAGTSTEIGIVVNMMGKLLILLIDILPLLKTALTVYLSTKVLSGITAAFKSLPEFILKGAQALSSLSVATTGLAGIMGDTVVSVGLLGGALVSALPAMLALAGAAALIAVPIKLALDYAKDMENKKRMVGDKSFFEQETTKAFSGKNQYGKSIKDFDTAGQVEVIKDWAANYGKTTAEVAELLSMQQLITVEVAKQLGYDPAIYYGKMQAEAAKAAAEAQQNALLAKRAWLELYDVMGGDSSTNKSFTEPTAQGYMGTFKSTLPTMDYATALKSAGASADIVTEATKAVYEQRAPMIENALKGVINLFPKAEDKSVLKKYLVDLMNENMALLNGFKSKADDVGNQLKKSWSAQEWAVKATPQRLDDIELERQKAIYAAEDEYATRIALMQKMGIDTAYQYEELAKLKKNIDIVYAEETAKEIQAMQIANFAKMQTGDPEYWANMQAKAGQGNMGAAAATTLQGTEVGSLMAGADPVTMAIMAFADFAKSIENVNKVLNPFATIFEAMRSLLEPLMNNSLQPLVNILEMLGEVVAAIILPFLGIQKILTSIIYIALTPLMAILQIVGGVFTWLYDKIIVPVANAFVRIVNGVIEALNKLPGVNIRYLDQLETSTDALRDWTDLLNGYKDGLSATIAYLSGKLRDQIDAQIGSLKDLYEVGAISGAEYMSKLDEVNKYAISENDKLIANSDKQLTTMQDIYQRLVLLYGIQEKISGKGLTDEEKAKLIAGAGVPTSGNPYKDSLPPEPPPAPAPMPPQDTPIVQVPTYTPAPINTGIDDHGTDDAGFGNTLVNGVVNTAKDVGNWIGDVTGWWDVGSPNIPNDQIAMVHKGEGIIPATFMDGIRRGELSLSGKGNEGSGQQVNVYVTVQGTVQAEKDLAQSIANQIYTQRSRGILTV